MHNLYQNENKIYIMTNWRKAGLITGAIFILLGHCLFFVSCKQPEVAHASLKPYYFQLDSFKEGRVLHFVSTGDTSISDQFWYLKSVLDGNQSYLIGQMYEANGQMTHQWSEMQTSSGMIMTDYGFAYQNPDTGAKELNQANIRYDDIFPFEADSGGIFLFRMAWKDLADTSQKMELIRNRIYTGDTLLQYGGKTYNAIHFVVRDRIEADKEGILGLNVTGSEIYVRDKGLMRYSKILDADRQTEFTLYDVYSIPTFRSKFAWGLTPTNE